MGTGLKWALILAAYGIAASAATPQFRWDIDKIEFGTKLRIQELRTLKQVLSENLCTVQSGWGRVAKITAEQIQDSGVVVFGNQTYPSVPIAEQVKKSGYQLDLLTQQDETQVLKFRALNNAEIKDADGLWWYSITAKLVKLGAQSPYLSGSLAFTLGKSPSYTFKCVPAKTPTTYSKRLPVDAITADYAHKLDQLLALKDLTTRAACDVKWGTHTTRLHPHMLRRKGIIVADQLYGPGQGIIYISEVPSPKAGGFGNAFQVEVLLDAKSQATLKLTAYDKQPTGRKTYTATAPLTSSGKASLTAGPNFSLTCN
jgi:hypothetical protein